MLLYVFRFYKNALSLGNVSGGPWAVSDGRLHFSVSVGLNFFLVLIFKFKQTSNYFPFQKWPVVCSF